jgi:hypothetical protein
MKLKIILSLCLILSLSGNVISQSLVELRFLGRYSTGVFDEGATEIVAYDDVTERLFSVNGNTGNIDLIDISDVSNPVYLSSIDLSPFGGGANSVDFRNGVLAAAVEADVSTDDGNVVFFDAFGQYLGHTQVGALPDMLLFSKGGDLVLVACEGEPNDDYSIDPLGTVAIIEVSGSGNSFQVVNSTLLDFTAYDNNPVPGVRVFGPGASFSQDMEPEYIALSGDGKTAYVALQENNAIAKIDVLKRTIEWVRPLGFKDHNLPGFGLDASDRNNGQINIANWPLKGMYQPDAIGSYEANGETYLVTANEGDVREYDTYEENERVKDLVLDPVVFPDFATLQEDENIGRIDVTTSMGDIDGDGDYDELYSFGGRSFTIWNSEGDLVFDSGDFIEQHTATLYPDNFNSSNTNNNLQNRSDNKGPEPEGLTIKQLLDSTYLFLGLERIGGVMVFNITDPNQPYFVQYVNDRDFTIDPEDSGSGDLGPEGLLFIPWNKSPNRQNILVVANEISGTITLYSTDNLCGNKRVNICYNGNTMCVNSNQLPGYLSNGAVIGACAQSPRIAENKLSSLEIMPNPVNDVLYVNVLNTGNESVTLNIFDVSGRLVITEDHQVFPSFVEVSGLEPGSYYMSLKLGSVQQEVRQFTVAR